MTSRVPEANIQMATKIGTGTRARRRQSRATLMGANAVISMRFDSTELAGTMSEIVAYGTAVVLAPESGSSSPQPAE